MCVYGAVLRICFHLNKVEGKMRGGSRRMMQEDKTVTSDGVNEGKTECGVTLSLSFVLSV